MTSSPEGRQEAAVLDAFEFCAKVAEGHADLLEEMRGIYPGDPYGALGRDANKMRKLAKAIRRLRHADLALIPAKPAVEVVEALNDKAHDLIMRAVDLACNHLIFYDQHFDIEARQKFYDIRDDMRQWLVDVADAALQAPATPDAQTEVGK